MITILFGFANDKIMVTINGNQVYFSSTAFGAVKAPIEGLRLNYSGVCNEFPDLRENEDWENEACKRFKNKIESYNTEEEKADYIIEDLKKFGYIPEQKQKEGFRPRKIK